MNARITWVEKGTNNAAMIGLDNVIEVKTLEEARLWAIYCAECQGVDLERYDVVVEMTDIEPWCVCAKTADGPWEECETGLSGRETAEHWMRQNAARLAQEYGYLSFYCDREGNDGLAASYYDLHGGEVLLTNVN